MIGFKQLTCGGKNTTMTGLSGTGTLKPATSRAALLICIGWPDAAKTGPPTIPRMNQMDYFYYRPGPVPILHKVFF